MASTEPTSSAAKAPVPAPAVQPVAKAAPKPAVKSVAKKAATKPSKAAPANSPKASSIAKPAAKPAAKAPAKTAAKPAPLAAKKAASKVAPKAKVAKPVVAKPAKEKKVKLVRDSFTMPKLEFMVVDALKLRAAKLATPVKKTELIRAGIKALAAMNDAAFLAAVRAVPNLKTGRPAQAK